MEILLMDHVVFYEDRDTDLMIRAEFFQKNESERIYPVHIYIRRGINIGSVFLQRNSGVKLIYSRNSNKDITITIDGNRTCLGSGEFAFVSSNALYSMIPETGNDIQDVMIISFQPDYLRRMYSCLGDYDISGDAPKAAKDMKAWMAMLCEQLYEHVEESSENEKRHFEVDQLLFTMMQIIFHDFLVGRQKTSGKQYEMRNKMAKVLEYLQEHYRDDLTTQFVADHFWYTREYFCRLFKRYANETFKSYLTNVRLMAVVHEMQISDKSAVRIGMEQGFSDGKSLFSAFRKKYGMTPAQWKAGISAGQMTEKE